MIKLKTLLTETVIYKNKRPNGLSGISRGSIRTKKKYKVRDVDKNLHIINSGESLSIYTINNGDDIIFMHTIKQLGGDVEVSYIPELINKKPQIKLSDYV